jgi:hypothetical protein
MFETLYLFKTQNLSTPKVENGWSPNVITSQKIWNSPLKGHKASIYTKGKGFHVLI